LSALFGGRESEHGDKGFNVIKLKMQNADNEFNIIKLMKPN